MNKYIFVIVSIVMLYIGASYFVGKIAGDGMEAFWIENQELNMVFIAELKRNSVSHKIDDDLKVWFMRDDRDVVHEIARRVMSGGDPDYFEYRYINQKYTELLGELLSEHGVDYVMVENGGLKLIRLYTSNMDEWLPLKNDIDGMLLDEVDGAWVGGSMELDETRPD